MEDKAIIFKEEAGIASITLNRPERLNALTLDMSKELLNALTSWEKDEKIRAIVLSGAGRAFCSGADVNVDTKDVDPSDLSSVIVDVLNNVILKIRDINKPVIASIRGNASGAGFSLVLPCDLAIASETAKFNLAFIRIGVTPDLGISYFLPRLIGLKRANMLFFTGDMINAEQAENLGIVNRVVPDEQLEQETQALASRLSKGPTLAIGRTKKLINDGDKSSLEVQLENERQIQILSPQTEDYKEGVKAFLEKRPPKFKGR
ncbi:enoyl-CoA hydratase/isomerase family protein [Thermodesulfobacteriota bacterium]